MPDRTLPDPKDLGAGLLEVLRTEFEGYVDLAKPEAIAKLQVLAKEGVMYLQAKLEGNEHAERMLRVLKSEARLFGARHALEAQAAAERAAGQIIERSLGYLAAFLRGFLGMPPVLPT